MSAKVGSKQLYFGSKLGNVFFIFWIPDKAKKQFVTQYISTHFNISSPGGRRREGEKLLSRQRKQMFNCDREFEK